MDEHEHEHEHEHWIRYCMSVGRRILYNACMRRDDSLIE